MGGGGADESPPVGSLGGGEPRRERRREPSPSMGNGICDAGGTSGFLREFGRTTCKLGFGSTGAEGETEFPNVQPGLHEPIIDRRVYPRSVGSWTRMPLPTHRRSVKLRWHLGPRSLASDPYFFSHPRIRREFPDDKRSPPQSPRAKKALSVQVSRSSWGKTGPPNLEPCAPVGYPKPPLVVFYAQLPLSPSDRVAAFVDERSSGRFVDVRIFSQRRVGTRQRHGT